jgi:hypothetical protein
MSPTDDELLVLTLQFECLTSVLATELLAARKALAEREWQPIETAPKDGTVIWAVLSHHLGLWNGLQLPLRHPGLAADGFDIGWNLAAPVGHGGFPDDWIAGWQPLPSPPVKETPE